MRLLLVNTTDEVEEMLRYWKYCCDWRVLLVLQLHVCFCLRIQRYYSHSQMSFLQQLYMAWRRKNQGLWQFIHRFDRDSSEAKASYKLGDW